MTNRKEQGRMGNKDSRVFHHDGHDACGVCVRIQCYAPGGGDFVEISGVLDSNYCGAVTVKQLRQIADKAESLIEEHKAKQQAERLGKLTQHFQRGVTILALNKDTVRLRQGGGTFVDMPVEQARQTGEALFNIAMQLKSLD